MLGAKCFLGSCTTEAARIERLPCVQQYFVHARITVYVSIFDFFLSHSTTPDPIIAFEHGRPKPISFLALVKPNRVKTWLRQSASGGTSSTAGGGQALVRSRVMAAAAARNLLLARAAMK